jgi:pimeloyl-ACP methyl ester carboxylesterase
LDEAVDRIMDDPDRVALYTRSPWLRDVDRATWAELADPAALARAVREVVADSPVPDRELLRRVEAPVFLIAREGDVVHPASLGRILGELFPNSELVVLDDEADMYAAVPMLVHRVREFLTE